MFNGEWIIVIPTMAYGLYRNNTDALKRFIGEKSEDKA